MSGEFSSVEASPWTELVSWYLEEDPFSRFSKALGV